MNEERRVAGKIGFRVSDLQGLSGTFCPDCKVRYLDGLQALQDVYERERQAELREQTLRIQEEEAKRKEFLSDD